ncbi:MAG: shikimate dehydrogenase [Desulfuromonadales bacterium]|nr:shikimate dehydrogenase [Desulfuromonadales bacterium]
MISITGKTALLGIFGDPVEQTLSPRIQNAALAAAGIDAVYLPFHILPEQLQSAVAAIRSLNLIGINVTVPHKETILPFLDEIDPAAALIGAVNTVVNRDGYLVGFNTDVTGFLASLRQNLQFDPQGKEVVVIGAGGACRAALSALARHGAVRITIANRTQQKAERLAEAISLHYPATDFVASALVESKLAAALATADLLVNTTSIGLTGDVFADFMIDRLPATAVVYDMVYAKETTPLIRSAQQRRLGSADGRGMLVAQGEAAFVHWFGAAPESGVMAAQII